MKKYIISDNLHPLHPIFQSICKSDAETFLSARPYGADYLMLWTTETDTPFEPDTICDREILSYHDIKTGVIVDLTSAEDKKCFLLARRIHRLEIKAFSDDLPDSVFDIFKSLKEADNIYLIEFLLDEADNGGREG